MRLKTSRIPALLLFITAFLAACSHQGKKSSEPPSPPPSSQTTGYDAELTGFEYPFPVKFHEFESQRQSVKMAYLEVEPEKPNGRTVVLLHGKNFSAAYWKSTILSLTNAGYRVIAPDQIGFGKSTKPAAYQFTFQALAENTRGLLEKLNVSKASVIGHSMGGMLATRFALMYPDTVEKLILVNPIGLEDWKTMVSYRTVDQNYQQELKATPESIKEYQRQAYFAGEWKSEYDSLVEVLGGWTKNPDYPRVAWNAALASDMIFTQPVMYEFNRIRVPTLLIIGQRDRTAIGRAWAPKEIADKMGNYPALGRKAARAIPGARLVEIAKVGHMPQVENFPVYEKAVLGFLK